MKKQFSSHFQKAVLQNTIDNFASTKLKYKFLEKKIDIDKIIDIENRK